MALPLSVLYACCLAVVTVYGINQGWLSWKRASRRVLPVRAPEPGKAPPGVTVQLPVYNESLVVRRLIDAVARLEYPREAFEIQVLDDSTDDTTSIVADAVRHWRSRGIKIIHLHRRQRTGFKAGALAEGLRVAKGELIALFDADFLPDPDFLTRIVPEFERPEVGCVQARWSYLNADVSLLTKLQSIGLDSHFELEQQGRLGAGYCINFNGTAGIWRTSCIEDSGGWSSDTLTEDLDLSYRAQLAGWRLLYRSETHVPSELPADMASLRSQQRRWTVGAVQSAAKLLPRVWSKQRSGISRFQATMHLTAPIVYPAVLLLAILNAPVGLLQSAELGLGRVYYMLLSLGTLGLAGYLAAHIAAQRGLYADWPRRLWGVPVLLGASMGLSLANSLAVGQALAGKGGPFVRTPKYADVGGSAAWWRSSYVRRDIPGIVLVELVLALALSVGAFWLVAAGAVGAVPFQVLFAGGTWCVVWASIAHAGKARRASPE